MHRFRIDPREIQDNRVRLDGDRFNHLRRVLRLGLGDMIGLFDGQGGEYRAVVRELTAAAALCEIIDAVDSLTEPPVRVVLVQGLPKGDKMDLVIQKATELGVSRIIPAITSRTVVRLDPKQPGRKPERWQVIAAEAARQCRRAVVPAVGPVMDWTDAVRAAASGELNGSSAPGSLLLLPWEKETDTGLKQVLQDSKLVSREKTVCILIGPEGGLSPAEVDLAVSAGAIPVSLGPRILRTETAALAVLAAIMYELGDLGGQTSCG